MTAHVIRPMSREQFALVGFGLMVVKYAVEALLVYASNGAYYSPLVFLIPVATWKIEVLQDTPSWLILFLTLWSLPFVFIALHCSIRRALDAGLSPWIAFFILFPVMNLIFMLIMCGIPTASPEVVREVLDEGEEKTRWAPLRGVVYALVIGAVMLGLGVFMLGTYGAVLFFITPIIMGGVSSYQAVRFGRVRFASGIGIGICSVLLALAAMLLFGLEGVLCLAMASPIVVVGGAFGGFFGALIGLEPLSAGRTQSITAVIAMLPMANAIESYISRPHRIEAVTVVEIDAAPNTVWNEVVAFSPIRTPPSGILACGIAYPVRARIEGNGVGAVRYCEFSTGSFVEPITVWDAPERLAFDVSEQPEPMTELSPWGHIDAPHLHGFMSSRRGEFRLIRLAENRTRLEGHTWYEVDMYPQGYWSLWSDSIIHAIHGRVLEHIRTEAEQKLPLAPSL